MKKLLIFIVVASCSQSLNAKNLSFPELISRNKCATTSIAIGTALLLYSLLSKKNRTLLFGKNTSKKNMLHRLRHDRNTQISAAQIIFGAGITLLGGINLYRNRKAPANHPLPPADNAQADAANDPAVKAEHPIVDPLIPNALDAAAAIQHDQGLAAVPNPTANPVIIPLSHQLIGPPNLPVLHLQPNGGMGFQHQLIGLPKLPVLHLQPNGSMESQQLRARKASLEGYIRALTQAVRESNASKTNATAEIKRTIAAVAATSTAAQKILDSELFIIEEKMIIDLANLNLDQNGSVELEQLRTLVTNIQAKRKQLKQPRPL